MLIWGLFSFYVGETSAVESNYYNTFAKQKVAFCYKTEIPIMLSN